MFSMRYIQGASVTAEVAIRPRGRERRPSILSGRPAKIGGSSPSRSWVCTSALARMQLRTGRAVGLRGMQPMERYVRFDRRAEAASVFGILPEPLKAILLS